LTENLLKAIDYVSIIEKRKKNYQLLDQNLRQYNQLNLTCSDEAVPMVYPFLPKRNAELKKKLIENKIFVATYWPNVLEWCEENDWEYQLAQQACFLPMDHRYGEEEMNRIVDVIM
jgi:dTDP-4-amino-4,6-dideoxygalactose transaminase